MAVTVERLFPDQFQGGSNPTRTCRYKVEGTTDQLEAEAALAAEAPATYGGLVRDTYGASEEGNGLWIGEVRYVSSSMQRKAIPVGETRESGSIGGGTQHITQSKQTPTTYSANERPAPNFKGAIGVSSDSVEGCDINVGSYRFSYTKAFTAAQMETLKPVWYAMSAQTPVNNAA